LFADRDDTVPRAAEAIDNISDVVAGLQAGFTRGWPTHARAGNHARRARAAARILIS
jgi:hypothetical protein